jgi:uncharacterized membrane protein YhfC
MSENVRMRPKTVITLAVLLAALFAAAIFQLSQLPDGDSVETTVAMTRAVSPVAS